MVGRTVIFFVCSDNWERLPEEGDDYVRIRKTWGTPSSAGVCAFSLYLSFIYVVVFIFNELYLFCVALTRPTLSQVWRDCVLKAHHLTNRQYTYYIQLDFYFVILSDLSPVLSSLTSFKLTRRVSVLFL